MEKYFKILKLKYGASLEDVKRAYKTQVKIWHPDRFPLESPRLQKKAHDMFQKITVAYKRINAQIRHEYRRASGWKGNQMAEGNSSMTTATSTKEIFWKTSCTDRGNITTQTGIFTKENSKMIYPMDKGSMSWKMGVSIREYGNKED